MGVHKFLIFLSLLLQFAARSLGECDSCSANRNRRDIIFPDDAEFNPITRYLSPEQIERLNNIETAEEIEEAFDTRSSGIEPRIATARVVPQLQSRIAGAPGEPRSEYSQTRPKQGIASRLGSYVSNIWNKSTSREAKPEMESLGHTRTGVRMAVLAKCQPTLQSVPLKKSDDLTILYWPYCVQLERCSGCCINDRQQSCQPTKTESVPLRVNRYLLNGMIPNGTEIVHLEKHLECKCSCIVKATHCNARQEYSPRECSCKCTNLDEKRKCLAESYKLWDNKDCACRCRDYPEGGCTTGLYFDFNSCTCVAAHESRRRQPDNTYKLEKRRRRWQNRTTYAVVTAN